MRLTLKLLPPFVLPFIILGMMRLLWLAAGAEWSRPQEAALMSLLIGGVIGAAATATMMFEQDVTRQTKPRSETKS
jgi:hypothetical protein